MIFTNRQRIQFTKIAICLSLVVIFLFSHKLWLNVRNYPLAPVFDFLPALPAPFDYAQLILPVLLLLVIAVVRNGSPFILVFFVLFWLLVAGDQNRLQPYYYQFAFMLLVIGAHQNATDKDKERFTLNCLRLIIAGSYLWAGIHKLNMEFVERFFAFLTNGVAADGNPTWKNYAFLAVPVIEIGMAVGLMMNRYRTPALVAANLMHASIAIFLSPIGMGWNFIVIPWNIGLIFMNIFLFYKVNDVDAAEILRPRKSPIKIALLLLFFIMPFFNLFGMWDHYISSSLYSFKSPYAKVYIDDTLKSKLPGHVTRYCYKDKDGIFVETTYWIIGELEVLPYPEPRVYRHAEEYICTFDVRDSCHARLVIY